MNEKIFTDENAWEEEWQRRHHAVKKRCARCLYNDEIPGINFDKSGICNYCHTHDQLMKQYQSNAGKNTI